MSSMSRTVPVLAAGAALDPADPAAGLAEAEPAAAGFADAAPEVAGLAAATDAAGLAGLAAGAAPPPHAASSVQAARIPGRRSE